MHALGESRHNSIILTNSIILGVIGLVVASQRLMRPFISVLCLAGFALSIFWYFLAQRGINAASSFYYLSTKLEEQYLPPVRTFLVLGSRLGGRKASEGIRGEEDGIPMFGLESRMHPQLMNLSILLVFLIVYMAILVLTWGGFFRTG